VKLDCSCNVHFYSFRTQESEKCLQLVQDSDAGKSNICLSHRMDANVGTISQLINFGRTLLSQDEKGISTIGEFFNMYQAQEATLGESTYQVISKDFVRFKGVKYAPQENVLAFIKHYLMPVDPVSLRTLHATFNPVPPTSTDLPCTLAPCSQTGYWTRYRGTRRS
jgi:hypothetical protein